MPTNHTARRKGQSQEKTCSDHRTPLKHCRNDTTRTLDNKPPSVLQVLQAPHRQFSRTRTSRQHHEHNHNRHRETPRDGAEKHVEHKACRCDGTEVRPCCNVATETVEDDSSAARCQHKTVYHKHFCTRLPCVGALMPHQKTATCDTRKFEMYTTPKSPSSSVHMLHNHMRDLDHLHTVRVAQFPITSHSTCSTSPMGFLDKPNTVALRHDARAVPR